MYLETIQSPLLLVPCQFPFKIIHFIAKFSPGQLEWQNQKAKVVFRHLVAALLSLVVVVERLQDLTLSSQNKGEEDSHSSLFK